LLKRWLALPLKDSNKMKSSGCFLFAGKSGSSKKPSYQLNKFRLRASLKWQREKLRDGY
jgi:hypothetical protein